MITASPLLFDGMQWTGAAFLAWLGIQSLRSAGGGFTGTAEGAIQHPVVQGFSIAFLNPKLAIFFLALFSQFLDAEATFAQKVLMVVTVGAIDAIWYCTVSLALSRPAILSLLKRAEVSINRLFGLILLMLAIRLLLTTF